MFTNANDKREWKSISTKEYQRSMRKDAILHLLRHTHRALSIRAIGQGVGLKKSPYLLSLLNDMERDGLILWDWCPYKKGQYMRVFSPSARDVFSHARTHPAQGGGN
jgi:hypothetical protein